MVSILPQDPSTDRIRRLALEWTAGIPRGWAQILAIETRLREHAVVDREVKPSDDSDSPIVEFLFEQRRGPEYLFAGSAACLLRSLDYTTRLVSGFYARPDNYDVQKRHTAVFARDAHFWCEVFVGGNMWVTIEPSPGYEILGPPPTFIERLLETAYQLWLKTLANAVSLSVGLLLMILLLGFRRRIHERLLTWQWRWLADGTPQQRAVLLASLIERRLQISGQARPSGTTLLRWARREELLQVRSPLQRLATIASAARFAPTTDYAITTEDKSQPDELMLLEQQLSVRAVQRPETVPKPDHSPKPAIV